MAALAGKEFALSPGANISIDRTDPAHPVINATGGGSTITRANFIDHMISNKLAIFETFKSIDGAGWGVKSLVGGYDTRTAGNYGLVRHVWGVGNDTSNTATGGTSLTFDSAGAGGLEANFNTGTTATAECSIGFDYSLGSSIPNKLLYNAADATFDMYAFVYYRLEALSDATNTYLAKLHFFNRGIYNGTPTTANQGVFLQYTHSVNSGRWTISYTNTGLTTTVINTTVAVVAAIDTVITVRLTKTSATTCTVTVTINGTSYVITDSILYNNSYMKPAYRFSLRKSVGVTDRAAVVSRAEMYCTYPL